MIDKLTIWDFKRNIEKFTRGKWERKKIEWRIEYESRNPNLLKEVLLIEIDKYEIWETYRINKWTNTKNLLDNKADFIEYIQSSLNFQYWVNMDFKNFEEILLFLNNN